MQSLVARQSACRGLPGVFRATTAACFIQTRGKKQKFGAITRDPFKTFQKKLTRQQQKKHSLKPLMSDERAQMQLEVQPNITSLGQLISSYVPLEKFAKAPLYTITGLRQRWTAFKEGLSIIYGGAMIRRKLRKTDPFKPIEFARRAQEQFSEVNDAIRRNDKTTLRSLTTENASLELKTEFANKSFNWSIVEELERPRIVNARVAPMMTKGNLFGQVVVRMHTKQILALYNHTGKLIKGHPTKPKAVIDYVVLERHLVKPASTWRIASKLRPQLPWKAAVKKKDKLLKQAAPV